MATPPPPETPATPPEVPPEQTAPADPGGDAELRELVRQIINSGDLGFDPATVKKGVVTAIVDGTPPTLSLNISGDTTETVEGVRWLDSYAPQVNDTVLLLKQRASFSAIGRMADGVTADSDWTQATLASGFTHSGNGGGVVEFRKVWDNGSWKVQFRGQAARSSGTTVITDIGDAYTPASKRTIPVAPSPVTLHINGSGQLWIEFPNFSHTHGGGTHTHTIPEGGNDHDHSISTGGVSHTHSIPNVTQPSHSHSHSGAVANTSFVENHSHTGSTGSHSVDHNHGAATGMDTSVHTHTGATGESNSGTTAATDPAPAPTYVSLDGVEYFL